MADGLKASDLMVRCLENEGIKYVFGVPGEENADFLMSLEQSDTIRFILTRHEQGAAFMAEAYGRLTGNPAVALGTLGPGATNLITGVADANMDHAPMLVLTAQGDVRTRHKESHQVMDVVSMYKPVTKWAHSIQDADSIPEIVRKAVRLARAEKPGAVHLELPEDVARLSSRAAPLPPRRFRRPTADPVVVRRLSEMLAGVRRPIIIAGNGTIRKRSSEQLRRFCDLTGIGVISTFMAKGCVDRDSDYCLFTIGLQSKDHVYCAVQEADLVICIGYDMVEYPPRLWNPNSNKRIVHIDFNPAEIDRNYHPELELIGDIALTLGALIETIEADGKLEFDLASQALTRKLMLDDFAEHKDDDREGRLRPQQAIWHLREALGPQDILLSDVGAHKMWVARYYHCHEPNTCLIPNGFSSMGFALPGAVAAHLVDPERKIVALCGDGGFLMNVQEMETARRLDSDITVMVWDDGGYGLIAWEQENAFGRQVDVSFGNPDWLDLARSFGWAGYRVQRSRDLRRAIDQSLAYQGPALIAVDIDYQENKRLSDRLGKIQCAL